MLYRNKNGEYISGYLLDGEACEVNKEMKDKLNKHEIKAFDSFYIEDNDTDFWSIEKSDGSYCMPEIDNFVDKLFSSDPFEYADENEEYEGFDPDALEGTDFDIAYEKIKKEEEAIKDNKSITVSLEDLRSITKNTIEKFLNKNK